MDRKSTANQNLLVMPKPEALALDAGGIILGHHWLMVHSLRDSLVPYPEAMYSLLGVIWGNVYFILGAKDSILAGRYPILGSCNHLGFKYRILGPCITYWAVYPTLGTMYSVTGSVAYPKGPSTQSLGSEPCSGGQEPRSQGRDLLQQTANAPLPGRPQGWRHIPTVASAP